MLTILFPFHRPLLQIIEVELAKLKVVQNDIQAHKSSVDTLKNTGYNPNSIVLLPKWNDLAGH